MKLTNFSCRIALGLSLTSLAASAADLTWDGSVNNLWNTGSGNWGGPLWNNGNPDNAIFGSTGAGAVSVVAPITAGNITISSGYTFSGGTLTINGGTIDSSALGTGGHTDVRFNNVITGAGGLNITGHGNLSDSGGGSGAEFHLGGNNTFTGDVTINSGMVSFASDAAFGNTANKIVLAGGGLLATSNKTLPSSRGIVLSGGGNKIFRAYGGRTLTIDGNITGIGNVRHTDGGTLQLNGNNSFNGNLISAGGNNRTIALSGNNSYTGYTHLINASDVRLDSNNTVPDTSGVLLYANSEFKVNGKTDTIRGLFVGGSGDTSAVVNLGGSGSTGTLTVTHNSMAGGSPTNVGANMYAKVTGFGNLEYASATAHNASWDLLNNNNDFTGNVIITRGRLRINPGGTQSDAILGNANNNVVFNGNVVNTLNNQGGSASFQVTNGSNITWGAGRSVILNSGKEGTFYVWGGTTHTVNGQITGAGNLRKEDGGVLLLNNATNNYTGETRIVSGTIRLGATGAISSASVLRIGATGGTPILDLNGFNAEVAGLSSVQPSNSAVLTNGIVTGGSGGGTLIINGSGDHTFGGVIQDGASAVALTKNGSGTQTLTGVNTYTGTTTVNGGALVLNQSRSGFNTSVLKSTTTINSGATLTMSNNPVGWGESAGTTFNVNGGTINGSGGLGAFATVYNLTGGTISGTARLDLGAYNGHDGAINSLASATTSVIGGANSIMLRVDSGQSSYTIDVEDGAAATDLRIDRSVAQNAGAASLVKTGAGTLTLTKVNSFSGALTVNGGVLNAAAGTGGNASAIGNGSATNVVTVNNGATLLFSANRGAGYHKADAAINGGKITFNGGDASFAAGHTITFDNAAGTIDGSGQWRMRDAGNKVAVTAAASGSVISVNNLTLTTSGGNHTFEVADGAQANDLTVSSNIGGHFGGEKVTKTGDGTMLLSGNNTFNGGTIISGGTLVADRSATVNPLGTGAVSIASGAVARINRTTSGNLTIANGFNGAGELNLVFSAGAGDTYLTGVNGFGGTIHLSKSAGTTGNKWNASNVGAVAGSLVVDAGTQLYVGNGSTSFAGGITVQGTGNTENRGALRLGGTLGGDITLAGDTSIGTEGGTITGNITSGAAGTQTLTFGTGNSPGNMTVSGMIGGGTGEIALTKNKAGTLTLTGTNSYAGKTTVNEGTLALSGSGSIGNSIEISVQSGATFDVSAVNGGFKLENNQTMSGTGLVTGPMELLAGSILSPGNSPGTLTMNSSLMMFAGSTLEMELNGGDQTIGGGINDLVTGVTDLTLDGILNVSETGLLFEGNTDTFDRWVLIEYSGTLTDNGLDLGTMPSWSSGAGFRVDLSVGGQVALVAVPEPSSALLIVLGGIGFVFRRRK